MAKVWMLFIALVSLYLLEANAELNFQGKLGIPEGLGLDCPGGPCDIRFSFCDKITYTCRDDCDIICEDKYQCTKTCPGHAVYKFYKNELTTQVSTGQAQPSTTTESPTVQIPPVTTTESSTLKNPSVPAPKSKENDHQTRLLEAILILFVIMYITIVGIAAVAMTQFKSVITLMSEKQQSEAKPMFDKVRDQFELLKSDMEKKLEEVSKLLESELNALWEKISHFLIAKTDKVEFPNDKVPVNGATISTQETSKEQSGIVEENSSND